MENFIRMDVQALDATHGYNVKGVMDIDGVRTEINEHYATEAEVRTRLGTGFDIWASQVNSE